MRTPVEVDELRELAGRVAPVVLAGEQMLPVRDVLACLFPGGGLRRGGIVGVGAGGCVGAGDLGRGAPGSTSVLLQLVSAASADGSWVAFVGLPSIGWVAAAEAGLDLERVAVVPDPGGQWPMVAAAFLDAVDIVVVRPPHLARVRPADARRLASRARERGAVLVVADAGGGARAGAWPEAVDVRLTARASRWTGLGAGHGCLRDRVVAVARTGRGAASHERWAEIAV